MPDNAFATWVEVKFWMTGNFGVFRTFVNDTWVGNICAFETYFLSNTIGNESSEVASMLSLNTSAAFFEHKFVYTVSSRFAGTSKTTTTYNYCYFVGAYAMLFNHVEDGILAVFELVGNLLVLLYFLNRVLDVFGEDFVFAFKYRSFC